MASSLRSPMTPRAGWFSRLVIDVNDGLLFR